MNQFTDPERLAERRERVLQMTKLGFSAAQISAVLGVTTRTVQRDRDKMGCAQPVPPRITPEEIERARALLDDGCSRKEVARTLGRSADAIAHYFPGRCWTLRDRDEFLSLLRRKEIKELVS